MAAGYLIIALFVQSAMMLYVMMAVVGLGWAGIVSLPFASMSENDTNRSVETAMWVELILWIAAIQIGYKVTTLKHIQVNSLQPKALLIDCKITQIDKV